MRQAVRSVRGGDLGSETPVRLAIGVIVAIGVVALVWLMGHLGFRLGFAPIVRVPDLLGEPGGGLATGTMMVISIPRAIFRAGLAQPLWLMLGFAMIALPAATLAAAKPLTPGGPPPRPAIVLLAATGAICSLLAGAALVWWMTCPARRAMLGALPLDPARARAWYADLLTVAGLDTIAMICAALWVVLVLRLPIPLWLRAIAGSGAFFTLVVATVAMSISGAAATQVGAPRSVGRRADGAGPPYVILGSTRRHVAVLEVANHAIIVELRGHSETMNVTGHESIVGFLAAGASAAP